MHYYQHHIGDFIKDTSFLTNEEVGVYLKLLWIYYDTEQPLENDITVLTMKVNSRSNPDVVSRMLEMFFTLEADCWIHTRVEKELAEYQSLVQNRSKAGRASAEQRRNRRSTGVEQVLNNESTPGQLTNNHKPETINQDKTIKAFDAVRHLMSLGVVDQVARDYVKQRKKKPTMTAINRLEKEARKANISLQQALEICCARGWEGFNADWIRDKRQQLTGQQSAWLTITGQTLTSEDDYHGRTIEADSIPPALLGE